MGEASDRVRVVRKDERTVPPAAQTPGMRREQAIGDDHSWVGAFAAAGGTVSGWHHHGDYDSYIYVFSGHIRLEFGPGGREHADAAAEDFIHVPRNVVHREGNPGEVEARAVLVRVGSGASLINVDGPEGSSGQVKPG